VAARPARVDGPDLLRRAAPVGGLVALFVVMAWRWRWTHDDGFITFRVVDQLFAGNGPVYNQGERVEAFTSPLHLGALVVLRALFGWAIDQAWLSLLLTLGAAAGGLVAAADGARSLARAGGARGTLVPFALVVPAVLPPMWEYATAGLETGLAIGWVGASFAALARLAAHQRSGATVGPRRALAIAVLVGLGPLVRPEGALLSLAFVVALCSMAAVRDVPRWRLVAAALALPVAYQVFRMGYYASLVPNTALAKAAGESRWDQGWYYLVNTVGPYALVVPLLAMVVWVVGVRRRRFDRMFGGSDGRRLVALLVGAALLHVLYVVRVGGDYMHARMLLVPLFALCCPLAMVPLPRSSRASGLAIGTVTVMGGWALLVLFALRAPEPGGFFDEASIADQRVFYSALAGSPHPVTLDDWRRSPTYGMGTDARTSAERDEDVLLTAVGFVDVDQPYRAQTEPGAGVSVFVDGIGVVGARAGTDVHVIDLHGLAHPLASRMPILRPRVLPGHERALPLPWALAEARVLDDDPSSEASVARLARDCPPVDDLLAAITGPAGVGGFLGNVLAAPGLSRVEIPKDPAEVVAGCDGGPSGTVVGGS
jgi:arabinofuranosyltransferase